MWHSGSSGVPKYGSTSGGHWLASASSMRPAYRSSIAGAQLAQDGVRLGQVLAVGPVALDEVGHRVEAQPVDAEVEPEAHHPHAPP